MDRHRLRTLRPLAAIGLIATVIAACGAGGSSATSSPTGPPPAATFDEYAIMFCSAWGALFEAVGNPDTGAGSDLSLALDAAVEAKDGLEAGRLAGEIVDALEDGRRSAAAAGGWAPATRTMDAMDRVFVAFEAMTAAKVAVATGKPNAVDPQVALEQAGGIEAWAALLMAYQAMTVDRPADQASEACPGLPVAP